jgi:transcription antitermination protein NusB
VSLGPTRREARERAMSLLYEAEVKGVPPSSLLEELEVEPDPFVADVLRGVTERCAHIDGLISKFSVDWTLDRMPAIDRNILRMAVYELSDRPDIPVGAVISEAVELAKQFSTDESGRFVNGLLSSVAAEVR